MPTSTLFRLPPEKRERLMEACWGELTRARFEEVSVNRVISAAEISRGSFYQYFTDREDMIRYLMENMRRYFVGCSGICWSGRRAICSPCLWPRSSVFLSRTAWTPCWPGLSR